MTLLTWWNNLFSNLANLFSTPLWQTCKLDKICIHWSCLKQLDFHSHMKPMHFQPVSANISSLSTINKSFSQNHEWWSSSLTPMARVLFATWLTMLLTEIFKFYSVCLKSIAWQSSIKNEENISLRISVASLVFLAKIKPRTQQFEHSS